METQPSQDTPVLRMEQVSFGSMLDARALVAEEVNWTVRRGDYWVIAGLQGAGKTDLLALAGGLMAPRGGQYFLFGESMPIFEDRRLKVRLRLGLVFDSGQLLGRLTIRENIGLPLRYHFNKTEAEVAGEVNRWLDAMDIAPFAGELPGTVGRAWQKRAALARALVLKPEALLIDNPLGGLDLRHTNWWLTFLDRLQRGHELLDNRPVTLVVTSAELRPWKGRARQFALLSGRRLRVLGDWSQTVAAREELLREILTEQTQTG
jgi:ABC-type transporter Mla maintaining outer membrane lipid asymmetry ATPase subunit MlaF